MTNNEDPDEMQHNAAFHQGLHCLLRLELPSGIEIHHNLETIVLTGSICSNTDLSDLSIVGICDIFVYQMRHKVM